MPISLICSPSFSWRVTMRDRRASSDGLVVVQQPGKPGKLLRDNHRIELLRALSDLAWIWPTIRIFVYHLLLQGFEEILGGWVVKRSIVADFGEIDQAALVIGSSGRSPTGMPLEVSVTAVVATVHIEHTTHFDVMKVVLFGRPILPLVGSDLYDLAGFPIRCQARLNKTLAERPG